jgi:hypothetical protein
MQKSISLSGFRSNRVHLELGTTVDRSQLFTLGGLGQRVWPTPAHSGNAADAMTDEKHGWKYIVERGEIGKMKEILRLIERADLIPIGWLAG